MTPTEYVKLDKPARVKVRPYERHASRKMRAAALKSAWVDLVGGFAQRGGVPDMFWHEPGIWVHALSPCAWNLKRIDSLCDQLREYEARFPRCIS